MNSLLLRRQGRGSQTGFGQCHPSLRVAEGAALWPSPSHGPLWRTARPWGPCPGFSTGWTLSHPWLQTLRAFSNPLYDSLCFLRSQHKSMKRLVVLAGRESFVVTYTQFFTRAEPLGPNQEHRDHVCVYNRMPLRPEVGHTHDEAPEARQGIVREQRSAPPAAPLWAAGCRGRRA